MVERPVTVTDLDKDGYLTVDEAVVAAHDAYFEGGAAAGYEVGGAYNSVQKLWGVPTSNTLFYVNGEGIPSGVTADTVAEGDAIYASVNKDDIYYGDWYTVFMQTDMAAKEGANITVNVKGNWGMAYTEQEKVKVPLKDIQIGLWKDGAFEAIDGAVTDENGNATFKLPAGEYLLTAEGTVPYEVTDWSTYEQVMADCPIMAPFSRLEVSKDNKLETEKSEASNDLQDVVDLNDYRAEEQNEILAAMVEAQAAIAAAGSSDEIEGIVSKFKEDVAMIKTAEEKAKDDITAKITSTSVNVANKTLTVKYSSQNAKSYLIAYRVAGGTWKFQTSTSKSYKITGLSANKLYEVKVAGMDAEGNKGAYSASKLRFLANTTAKKLTAESKGFYIQVNKISTADKYQISYATKSDMSNAKTVTIKSGIHIKDLKANTKYYVQIRPIKTYNGVDYIGSSKTTMTVTTKK